MPGAEEGLDFCLLANHNLSMDSRAENNLGTIIKRQRVMVPLTLRELAAKAGVSASHLGRIERGERFPSASILRKIATPLGFDEDELFMLAGYLSSGAPIRAEGYKGLDPYVAKMLAREPMETQRAIIGILSLLKSLAHSTGEK
jgi:transcriptional regulator with XRE-family HTH domain